MLSSGSRHTSAHPLATVIDESDAEANTNIDGVMSASTTVSTNAAVGDGGLACSPTTDQPESLDSVKQKKVLLQKNTTVFPILSENPKRSSENKIHSQIQFDHYFSACFWSVLSVFYYVSAVSINAICAILFGQAPSLLIPPSGNSHPE